MKFLRTLFSLYKIQSIAVLAALLVLTGGLYIYFTKPCFSIPIQKRVEGTQGFRIWQGDTLKTFEHLGFKMCIPEGFDALGASEIGEGWARFPLGHTGVIIKRDAFFSTIISPKDTTYTVNILYPKEISKTLLDQYVTIISRDFTRVGGMFTDQVAHTHTVLITAGIAGNTVDDGTRIYPDPSEYLTTFFRTPEQSRAEQLFLHAIIHLYNRHRSDLSAYTALQSPFSRADFQEAEATWSEIALLPSDEGRKSRIEYMYRIHTLLEAGKYTEIRSPPFNDPEENASIVQSALVADNADNLDEQYGHYILMPLSLLAIEGLLQQQKVGLDLKSIFTDLHHNGGNFMAVLAEKLSSLDMSRIEGWLSGDTVIPRSLIDAGQLYYDTHN